MKELALSALLALTPTYTIDDGNSLCRNYHDVAGSIMWDYQRGFTITESVHQMERGLGPAREVNSLDTLINHVLRVDFRNMIHDAYGTPAYLDAPQQSRAVIQFASKYYVACVELVEDYKRRKEKR